MVNVPVSGKFAGPGSVAIGSLATTETDGSDCAKRFAAKSSPMKKPKILFFIRCPSQKTLVACSGFQLYMPTPGRWQRLFEAENVNLGNTRRCQTVKPAGGCGGRLVDHLHYAVCRARL